MVDTLRSSVDRAVGFEPTSAASSNLAGETKLCLTCKELLSLDKFGIKNPRTGLRQSNCKNCQRRISRIHYQENKQAYLNRNKRRMKEVMHHVDELKASTPCSDCGQYFKPKITDFHHRDSGEKYKIVSKLRNQTTLPLVLREIAKCDLLCANCHRERTFYS